eukprot:60695_1
MSKEKLSKTSIMIQHNYIIFAFLNFIFNLSVSKIQAYTGTEPLNSTSPLFTVKLSHNNTSIFPHVYYAHTVDSKYNCSIWSPGPGWHNRSVSWIEFGQTSSDETLIEISIKNGLPLFNNTEYPIQILPLSYNIIPVINNDYKSLSFKVKGNYKTISVEYGKFEVNNTNSNFRNALLIFIGDLSPTINTSASNVIYFSAGVHNITDKGAASILKLNSTVDTIYIERGAFVYGKIDDNSNTYGRLNVIGYGILCGSVFDYCSRWNNSAARFNMIESNRSVNIHGLTIYDPSWFMLPNELVSNSVINSFKGLGWYPNNDCLGIGTNGVVKNSFCRTMDDSFKMETGNNILMENNVVWQLCIGSVFQMGFFGLGGKNNTVRNMDVIHAEWRPGDGVEGVIDYRSDAVVGENCSAVYTNILFENIRIDTPVGRIIALVFEDISNNETVHVFDGMVVRNVTSKTQLAFVQTLEDIKYNYTVPINQVLQIENCNGKCAITGIMFEDLFIAGRKITNSNDSYWNLTQIGNDISNITYS